MKKISLCLVSIPAALAAFLTLAPVPVAAQLPLQLELEDDELVMTKLEPGAVVLYFSMSRFNSGYAPRNSRIDLVLTDDDQDGELRVRPERLPRKFLAVAVEMSSGRFGIWAPGDSPAREVPLPAASLQRGPGNRLNMLEDSRSPIALLLIRPGVSGGAWRLNTGDGRHGDLGSSTDGIVRMDLQSMVPIAEDGPPPPREYETGDLIFRVAPHDMEYIAARVVR